MDRCTQEHSLDYAAPQGASCHAKSNRFGQFDASADLGVKPATVHGSVESLKLLRFVRYDASSFQELCQIRIELRRIGIVVITALQEEELLGLGRGLE